jgi:GT2 family glycosyltransferase
MENNYPKVAIIILNWNDWQGTIQSLTSVSNLSYSHYFVVLVDNGSSDGSVEKLKEWSEKNLGEKFITIQYDRETALRGGSLEKESVVDSSKIPIVFVRNQENLGYPEGNNTGIAYALSRKNSADYVFILNNDATIQPDCISELIAVAQKSKAGIIGTIVTNSRNGQVVFWGTPYEPLHLLLHEFFASYLFYKYQAPDPKPLFWQSGIVQGCAMLLKSEMLQAINNDGYYLNSHFFIYCEEPDLCFRSRQAGYPVVIARDAHASHYYGKSMGLSSPVSLYYFTRNKLFLANMMLPWYVRILFNIWYILSRSVRALKFMILGKSKTAWAIFQGLIDGYRGVQGKWKYHQQYKG